MTFQHIFIKFKIVFDYNLQMSYDMRYWQETENIKDNLKKEEIVTITAMKCSTIEILNLN